MKPLITKAQLRAELEQAMSAYLQEGGEVKSVPRGVTGILDNRNLFAQGFTSSPTASRTLVNDVVETLEARKAGHARPISAKKPKKTLIKDDFGEPLRWVWEE